VAVDTPAPQADRTSALNMCRTRGWGMGRVLPRLDLPGQLGSAMSAW